jgi:hypothetical protein
LVPRITVFLPHVSHVTGRCVAWWLGFCVAAPIYRDPIGVGNTLDRAAGAAIGGAACGASGVSSAGALGGNFAAPTRIPA